METWLPLLGGYLFIFFARVLDMSLDVIRVLMLMRDKRLLAAIIGFLEVSIFILALNKVLAGGLDDPLKVIAYAGGFATGNYIGSFIENKLALGYLSLQVFPEPQLTPHLINKLRQEGFGVTSVDCQGQCGERTVLFVLLKRRDLQKALSILNNLDPNIFFNVSDARLIHGGVFPAKGSRLGK
ncbi:Uncharacterized protein YebE, UPF0316 family [Desulfofundulus australicus DSM 11792]|uniref:UPF0316 protein SAMN02745218_02732 n=1 Tax=Desulfofundulus australicus DSM 11792 TaxID=1121425 RepID=A0A1M5D6B1_9FIRM|nr:DUF2179 domain-containing protein [Desulfofundulus australicus]SHF62514.1 Uncharacterized protein YebE, UPF0316 family [Desulfofundulus australicus DSM 11792]